MAEKLACVPAWSAVAALLLVGTGVLAAAASDANDLPAIRLLRKGTLVVPPRGAVNLGEYLRALAAVGTGADERCLKGELARTAPAPAPAGKQRRPALALLAEALTGTHASFAVDSQGRWCIHEHADKTRRVSYAAAGGVFCAIDHFTRPD